MQEILLVVHLLLAIAIVVLVLLQRSEGGALGIGGGGGGGFMTGREAANLLTKLTAGFAGLFMLTSLALTILAQPQRSGSVIDRIEQSQPAPNQPAQPAKPSVPTSE